MISKTLCIGGEAGQGLVTIGTLLSKSLVRKGYHIVVTQSYQSRIRGGHNDYFIRVSPDPIAAHKEEIDLLIALDEASINIHRGAMSHNGWILLDVNYQKSGDRILAIPFKEFGREAFSNIAAFAVAGCLLGLDMPFMEGMIRETFGKKGDTTAVENLQVFSKAFHWVQRQGVDFKALPSVSSDVKRLMLNGNEAIALGAMAAGVKCGFFYPMTPATSIMLTLIKHAKKMGMVIEQAEDEIAAVNMAVGSSFCGAKSIVATSGGGFALMTEGISLAAMTETPLVIAIAQRPGPATGLPTRTEQGDLEFVLHAGHGEFPRAVYAPGSVEECFTHTIKAFNISEKAQSPVFILTDQFLADSYRAVTPFKMADIGTSDSVTDKGISGASYKRYALTPDGISPRYYPGMGEALVVGDSDEHTEEGHITEDLGLRKEMVRKRLRKMDCILSDVIPPTYSGDVEPDILFVCWGSSKGAVEEAAFKLSKENRRVGTLHFSQVWPLRALDFIGTLQSAKRVIGIEGNATAQFARLIRRETGFNIRQNINRYDGLPLTPSYILDAFRRLEGEV